VVIGRRASRVSEHEALEYVAGFTAVNDITARDLQSRDRQWVRGKSLDTFCPMGPALVTTDEVSFPGNLSIECLVNGKVQQSSNTGEMIFGVQALIGFISAGITLLPGDVIATGTPAGVGTFRHPPEFLQDGDEVIVRIEGIGDLVNSVCVPAPSP
jgi:2-keto-4-pentenoate hydratase/2-oxohepta-3-ene-1,7-dioic acid hydratase in catechol pathway